MTLHEQAVAFAHIAEQDPRIKELAQKQNNEGLTDAETWEFVDRLDRLAWNPFVAPPWEADDWNEE